MREIKFRAWDKENKAMIYPKGILFDGRIVEFSCGMLEPFEGCEIMQFTGLYDKNGREIYEGDICETVTYSGMPFATIDVVKFSRGAFKLTDNEDELVAIYLDDSDIQSVEVLGNIYENPEILGG